MRSRSLPRYHTALLAALIATPLMTGLLSAADIRPPDNPANHKTPQRLPGKFIWAELVTDNVAATRLFYGGMFGWTFRYQGDYLLAYNAGEPLAGMIERKRPADKPDALPRWFGYLSASDVDLAQKTVTQAGGHTVVAPHEIPAGGRKAVFTDPEGALFGVIQAKNGDPADTTAAPGGWIWLQLLSHDSRRAATFYSRIGGYQIHKNTAENRSSDYILSSGGISRATVRTLPPNKSNVQPTWLPFVRVINLNKAVSKAQRMGGKVLVSARPDLLDGKVAVIADPTGAAVGLLESNPH